MNWRVDVTARQEVPGWVTGRKGPGMHVDLHLNVRKIGVGDESLGTAFRSCPWLQQDFALS